MPTTAANYSESLVKHTSAGEMPDPSKFGQLKNRLRADASLLTGRAGGPTILIPILLGGALAGGAYLIWRKVSKSV